MSPLAAGLALLAAVAFAGSTSVQHHAAAHAPARMHGTLALLRHLMCQPRWLAGQALSMVGLVLHAAALHLGSLSVVQPIIISGVVLAVPVRSALSRHWPWPREVAAVIVAATGLTVFLIASRPSAGREAPLPGPMLYVSVGGVLLALLAGIASVWARRATRRSLLLGVCSGALFGVVAGLIKAVLHDITHGGVLVALESWTSWALMAAGAVAVVTNQHAYRLARLSASMPVLNVVDGLVAIVFGYYAFQEVPRHSPFFLVIEALGFAAIAAGLVVVARLESEQAEECDTPPAQARLP